MTESVTLCAQTHVPDADWEEATARFSPDELGALVGLIVTINAWNAIGVTTRAWPVEFGIHGVRNSMCGGSASFHLAPSAVEVT